MKNNISEEDKAFNEGWDAFRAGKQRENNPYPIDSDESMDWAMGFAQGEWDSWSPPETV